MALFRDRQEAGRQLAEQLAQLELTDEPVALGLARGGVPVACEVARHLEIPLDAFVVRKLGVPFQPELAFGAIATGGIRILNDEVVRVAAIDDATIERVTEREMQTLNEREDYYRAGGEPIELEGRTALLVDDGIATGASMAAAVEAARKQSPARVVGVVPVAPPKSRDKIARKVDEMICLHTPDPFGGVGAWYDDFGETTDDNVRALLDRWRNNRD